MSDKPEHSREERRKYKRAEDIFIVTYRLKSPFEVALQVGDRDFAAVAVDIGEGGMGVDVMQEIPVGTQLRLKFEIENPVSVSPQNRRRRFELDGESRYCEVTPKQTYRVGCLFKSISVEDRAFIAEYVKDQALRKYVS